MFRRRHLAWILFGSMFVPPGAASRAAPPSSGVETRKVERLSALCRLWGAVKYFHPVLAYRDIDWDAALIRAIPKVGEARTGEEYAAAVDAMLRTLQDPATHVLRAREESGDGKPKGRLILYPRRDGILVVTIRDFGASSDFVGAVEKLRQSSDRLVAAKGIVFDLRGTAPVTEDSREIVSYLFSDGGINSRLSGTRLVGPGERFRMHVGFRSQASEIENDYYSAFTVMDGPRFAPEVGAVDRPVVFLVNRNSELPPVALALQAAGKGSIVSEGESSDASVVRSRRISLGEGWEAQVRLGELIYPDGTGGFQPDRVVPPSGDSTEGNPAFRTALDLIRHPASTPGHRPPLPAVVPAAVDPAYSEPSYPAPEHRILAAFRIWNVIHYFFPYQDLMGEDWDAVLKEFIPRMVQARDALEYHLAVAEMVTHIHDSHGFVSSPVLREHFGVARTPVIVRMIEGLPVITDLLDPALARSAKAEIGDVILTVDGEEARTRLDRYARYFPGSTPQGNALWASLMFLRGPDRSVATITVRDGADRLREIKLPRKIDYPKGGSSWRRGGVLRLLPGNIGYADLVRLEPSQVDEMFRKFRDTRAIIFDDRGYPRGTAWAIAPRLTDRTDVVGAWFFRPVVMAPEGRTADVTGEQAIESFRQLLPSTDQWRYRGKTVMLIDERTVSQAEHSGLFFEAANQTRFVGSPTAGADGDITDFTVPGGITVQFSGQGVRHADGRQLQRIGLVPDVLVRPTLAGIRSGRDEVLERALEYLGEN